MNKKNLCKTKIVYGNEIKEQINSKTDNEMPDNNEMIISLDLAKLIIFLKQFS
jgi:hypothetical protein